MLCSRRAALMLLNGGGGGGRHAIVTAPVITSSLSRSHILSSSSTAHTTTSTTTTRMLSGIAGTPVPDNNTDGGAPFDAATDFNKCSNDAVLRALNTGALKPFELEARLDDLERAVVIRRAFIEQVSMQDLSTLPYQNYDYAAVSGQCAENVIGYIPIPVGVIGPLLVDNKEYHVPMATTEGALIASTARGAKAISMSGGCHTEITRDSISRAPVIRVKNMREAVRLQKYVHDHFDEVTVAFESTSRFAKLTAIRVFIAGKHVFLRFQCSSGDAMGMNMISKGVEQALDFLATKIPFEVVSLSGNVCTDKKPSALNWLEGRGKTVLCEAVIKKEIVEKVLKTTVRRVVNVNYAKNLLGSAVAASIGGNNAHASNIVTATFLATGQDPAQNVESSSCLTLMEVHDNQEDLYISVSMPSLEVGTIGGGTMLAAQSTCLDMLGVRGANRKHPGDNAKQLARVIAATVLAGELSLMCALSAGHLVRSHLALNRKK